MQRPQKGALQSAGEVKSNLNAAFFLSGQFGGVSTPATANVSYTPDRAPTDLAFGGPGDADATNPRPARSASVGNRRGHAIRLMKRRG
jgi:hypothetical protein